MLGYTKLGYTGEKLTPRRMAVFHHGDYMDKGLKDDLMAALFDYVVTRNLKGSVTIEGEEITGEADFFFFHEMRKGIGEIKTMSNAAFERAIRGEIEESYQAQAWLYSKIWNVDLIVFICYRKESSAICEVIFDANQPELVVTQRFGGNERQLYTDDPLLRTEVRTPFDGHIEDKIRDTIRAVKATTGRDNLPAKPYTPMAELVSIQNREEKAEAEKRYGPPISKNGSWAKFATGRQILGWQCSYCQMIRHCWPEASLEFDNGKPKWIV